MQIRGLPPSTLFRHLFQSLRPRRSLEHCRVFICVADHFEPMAGGVPRHVQYERVARWAAEYPKSVEGIQDSRGQRPQHTFFYPIERQTFDLALVEKIAAICQDREGALGALEFHLHHGRGVEEKCLTSDQLRELLDERKRQFGSLGALGRDSNGNLIYGFVHGNWALGNAHPQGLYCGLNDELTILRESGCYADFTMPSAPAHGQTRITNAIYYAVDNPTVPKSHDDGIRAAVGASPPLNSLLCIQGPLTFDWSRRKAGVLPSLENADLHGTFPPSLQRVVLWLKCGVSVLGRPEWLFVKLHTHGAPERNAEMLLGRQMREFHMDLAHLAKVTDDFKYFYVTAREMAEHVKLLESGELPAY